MLEDLAASFFFASSSASQNALPEDELAGADDVAPGFDDLGPVVAGAAEVCLVAVVPVADGLAVEAIPGTLTTAWHPGQRMALPTAELGACSTFAQDGQVTLSDDDEPDAAFCDSCGVAVAGLGGAVVGAFVTGISTNDWQPGQRAFFPAALSAT